MSDLISRKKICDYIKGKINPYGKPFEGTAYELGLKIMRYINSMDSAYDVDKVVEEIKTLKEEALGEYNMGEYNLDNNIGNSIAENYRKDMNEGRCFAYDDAIEIVEQGSDTDDVCKWTKYPFDWFTGCDGYNIHNKQGNYCPRCGKKIQVIE